MLCGGRARSLEAALYDAEQSCQAIPCALEALDALAPLDRRRLLGTWIATLTRAATRSRSRDPRVPDHGLYALIDVRTGGAVNPAIAQRWTCSWTLDRVEQFLTGDW